VLDALAQDESPSFEVDAVAARGAVDAPHEQLAEARLHRSGRVAQHRVVGGHLPPAQDLQALGVDHLGDGVGHPARGVAVPRQEGDAGGVAARGRQVEVDDLAEEAVGRLEQDARPVAGVGLGAGGPPVVEVAQRPEAHAHDVVAAPALHVHHEGDAAGVVLEGGVVEALRPRKVLGHASQSPYSNFGVVGSKQPAEPGTTLALPQWRQGTRSRQPPGVSSRQLWRESCCRGREILS
jgi:hypothetical protein